MGTVPSITPVMPPKMKFTSPPRTNNMGVVRRILPPQSVPSQANTFTPVGTAISMVVTMNRFLIHCGVPV